MSSVHMYERTKQTDHTKYVFHNVIAYKLYITFEYNIVCKITGIQIKLQRESKFII